MYRGADKSLARPERRQATATEDWVSYYYYYYYYYYYWYSALGPVWAETRTQSGD